MTEPIRQTIHLHNRIHRPLTAQPITYGVPWPKGTVRNLNGFVVRDEHGHPLPAGITTLNTWDDDTIQWTLVDFQLDFEPSGERFVTIEANSLDRTPQPRVPVVAHLEGDQATVTNGRLQLALSARSGEFLRQWTADGITIVQPNTFDVTFKDSQGTVFSARAGARQLSLEHCTPVRIVLRIDGKHAAANGSELLDYFIRFEIWAGRPDVKITHSFRNRELPTPGIEISDYKVELATGAPADAQRCFTANNLTRHYLTRPLRVPEDPEIIASDTGDLDHYEETHKDNSTADCFVRNPNVLHDPPESKPWFLQDPKFRVQAGGNKCVWPYLALVGPAGGVMGSFAKMTALHPKSLTVSGSTLRFHLWPHWAGRLKITQGAGRSHVVHLAPVPAGATDLDIQNQYLSWEMGGVHTHIGAMSTLEISPDLEHVRRCRVFGIHMLPRYEPEKNYLFERKLRDAWLGITYGQLGAVDKVALPPAKGFWHYGDHGGNNEEMHARVFFENYFRSGDWYCAEYGLAFATHMMEVDHCAFSVDFFQNGGMVSHCLNHNDGTAYPSHMWFTELLHAYVLTGDPEYKAAALRACEALFRWVTTDEGFQIIAGDQREAGQPMINLTAIYHFHRDQRYLDACRKIITDYLMAATKKYGRMLDARPFTCPVKLCIYGDYASYEGMFWYWDITGDEEVRQFMLSQLQWRLTLPYMHVHGFHRTTDYNPAAYAYYMTGDRTWMDRVARPFRAAFRAARWPIGWIHSMYCIKAAFDLGIICDEDITVQ